MSVKPQKPLTPKQKKVLDFIKKFSEKHDFSPSLHEIASFFDKSITTAQHFVEELQEKGYLHKEENTARGISPSDVKSGRIFNLGYIAAGEPIDPIENPEPIDVPISMISKPGDYYALRVKGESMIEDGILDCDLIIIRHQNTAQDGDRVVAITEKGATLKIFRNRNGRIYLEPKNKTMKNIYPEELEIRGKFCGLIRKDN